MKRYRDIYPAIYDYENLYEAYRSARKGKTQRSEVMAFTRDLEGNLIELQNELIWRTYRVGRYREFYVNDPKKRLIMALPFRDRVIQWAIYRQINPLLDKRYISTSYACRVGGGTQRAIHQLQQYIRHTPGRPYALKLDVAKYFYRIDHERLMGILCRIFKDRDLLNLLQEIIDGDRECSPFGLDLCDRRADSRHRHADWEPHISDVREPLSERGRPIRKARAAHKAIYSLYGRYRHHRQR